MGLAAPSVVPYAPMPDDMPSKPRLPTSGIPCPRSPAGRIRPDGRDPGHQGRHGRLRDRCVRHAGSARLEGKAIRLRAFGYGVHCSSSRWRGASCESRAISSCARPRVTIPLLLDARAATHSTSTRKPTSTTWSTSRTRDRQRRRGALSLPRQTSVAAALAGAGVAIAGEVHGS